MDLLRTLLDPKFLVTLTLILCATVLAWARIIDGAAWMGMCSITGAAYGVGDRVLSATSAYIKSEASKSTARTD